jgi:hypothetical protein
LLSLFADTPWHCLPEGRVARFAQQIEVSNPLLFIGKQQRP